LTTPGDQTPAYATYNAAEKANYAASVAFILLYFQQYLRIPLTKADWVGLIARVFPFVYAYRDVSATNARQFYDREREAFVASNLFKFDPEPFKPVEIKPYEPTPVPQAGKIERYDFPKAGYEPEWLLNVLEDVREAFQEPNTPPKEATKAAAIVGKEVLNGGRRTLLRAIPDDPLRPKFARVQGGDESCAFCWMLISRGPVYHSESSAGLVAPGEMNAWHPNCDCRVVPVFDEKSDWPGKQDYLAALELWKDSTRETTGHESYLAFRRALGDGYANPGDSRLPVPNAA
jgi:hypothetical protein